MLKEGIPEDYTNRDDLARLLRFSSTANSTASSPGEASVSLSDYVARMKEGQDSIYYLLAPGAAAASSPHLEAFRAKGVEVLLLTEPVDGWVVTGLHEFGGHRLQSVAQGAAGWAAWKTRPRRPPRRRRARSSRRWPAAQGTAG